MTSAWNENSRASSARLAAAITRRGSRRTYDIIRWLVDRGRVDNAMRAYAYFRWVDDTIDVPAWDGAARVRYAAGQRQLLTRLLEGDRPASLRRQERILAHLVASDTDGHPGLRSYLDKMMAVMEFDAARCGQAITARDLERYSDLLSTAVMDALTYFIGHTTTYPVGPARTLAVRGAHIVHMLRDTADDLPAGYFNIPREILLARHLSPFDLAHPAHRAWVRQRVELAHACFRDGKRYIRTMPNLRAQLAGLVYSRRFEQVLSAIERNRYLVPDASASPVPPATPGRIPGAHLPAPAHATSSRAGRQVQAPSR